MDISSMFAVKCLDLEEGNEVLELCSAPGNKSMFACDSVAGVKVTGVEINQNRANVMKSLINKYGLSDRIEVVVEDATKFEPEKLFDRVLVDA
jgi:16S rRNA (cytosine967-C5)-methyltransferase